MNDKTADSNKRRLAVAAISAVALIILVQFVDSYCTEMFGKTQSLSVRTFLMDPRGMSSEAAVAYMSRGMLPFYLIGALTPFIRSYTDIIGRKMMMIINVALLAVGSAVCLLANNLWIYLLGNGILILGYSLDIHLIYIVDAVDRKHRGTVRGICGGVSMAAAMCIPLLRSLYVDGGGHNWQILYAVGIVGGLIGLVLVMLYRFPNITGSKAAPSVGGSANRSEGKSVDSTECSTDDGHIHFIKTFKDICRDHATRNLLISISVVGLATAGITYYNEPLCAFSGMGEGNVNTVLLIQPIASLAINVLTGILADKMERRYVVQMGIALSLISGMAFTLGVGHGVSSVLLGILWGCMNGFYFSAEELINLMVMESVDISVRGRASAMSTLSYGIGDQLGIFAISLVVGALGMRWAKLVFLVSPLVIAMVVLRRKEKETRLVVQRVSLFLCSTFSLRMLDLIFLYLNSGYIANVHRAYTATRMGRPIRLRRLFECHTAMLRYATNMHSATSVMRCSF